MSDTATMTLTDFLLARIAEDEAVARKAYPSGRWSIDTSKRQVGITGDIAAQDAPWRFAQASEGCTAQHIARHDPARVLAECAAKRQIMEELGLISGETKPGADVRRGNPLAANRVARGANRALRALASVYADHPDYRDEWRP